MKADKKVDALYEDLRERHGGKDAAANGYRLNSFFRREQKLLLGALAAGEEPILDIACGSGLMLEPLARAGRPVMGLDFNEDAAKAAQSNGITIVRGDGFNLPFADNTIAQAVNCQFLNQQPAKETGRFILEAARVLQPGGRLVILWRHADSLLHQSAHAVFRFFDQFKGQGDFPQYRHPMSEIKDFAARAGLTVEREAVTLPFLWPETVCSKGTAAKVIGASLFVVLRKPGP